MRIFIGAAVLLLASELAACASERSQRTVQWAREPATRPLQVFVADREGRVVKVPGAGTPGAPATTLSLREGMARLSAEKMRSEVTQAHPD